MKKIDLESVEKANSSLEPWVTAKVVADHLSLNFWTVYKMAERGVIPSVESGKKDERVELRKAFDLCRMTGATLVIAKLDRLSRDSHFIGSIMKSGIEFTACDMPTANKFTIHILAAVAEHEREMISQRTKSALQAKKAKGEKLGNPQNLNDAAAAKGRAMGLQARLKKSEEYAAQVYPTVKKLADQGKSLRGIAKELNQSNILTARGTAGNWSAVTVSSILKTQMG